ncbi:MAG: hypothetical protein HC861_04660 [Rhodospirillaceae bacterium]|nr:hypothetical protein [Rhodospirillaceae bacterium]
MTRSPHRVSPTCWAIFSRSSSAVISGNTVRHMSSRCAR